MQALVDCRKTLKRAGKARVISEVCRATILTTLVGLFCSQASAQSAEPSVSTRLEASQDLLVRMNRSAMLQFGRHSFGNDGDAAGLLFTSAGSPSPGSVMTGPGLELRYQPNDSTRGLFLSADHFQAHGSTTASGVAFGLDANAVNGRLGFFMQTPESASQLIPYLMLSRQEQAAVILGSRIDSSTTVGSVGALFQKALTRDIALEVDASVGRPQFISYREAGGASRSGSSSGWALGIGAGVVIAHGPLQFKAGASMARYDWSIAGGSVNAAISSKVRRVYAGVGVSF